LVWCSLAAGSEHLSGSDDEDLCDPVLMPAANADLHADPLALMPTADLLNFAF